MPNNYFKFKEFIIWQHKCSMKVCTDACIFGAWVANSVIKNQIKVNRCLDIGAGTGLLSLILAQKNGAFIDAIEIDVNACEQSGDNFKSSPWSNRLQVFNADAKYFCADTKYDFIFTNPPFYEDDLLSPKKNTNVARHDKGLKLDELIIAIKRNLCYPGNFAVLLPYYRIDYFENLAKQNHFFLKEKLLVKQTPGHDYFRGILLFSQTEISPLIEELTIKNNEKYSAEFVSLMKDYYSSLL